MTQNKNMKEELKQVNDYMIRRFPQTEPVEDVAVATLISKNTL
jgi:hypothetical protein